MLSSSVSPLLGVVQTTDRGLSIVTVQESSVQVLRLGSGLVALSMSRPGGLSDVWHLSSDQALHLANVLTDAAGQGV